MKFKLFKWIIPCLFFASCASIGNLQTSDIETYLKTDSKDIIVYSTSNIEKEYIVLGQVIASADAGFNAERPVELLRRGASKMGADAIIDMRLEIDYGYWLSAIKATGTAIKFK